jgi:proline racemase
MGMTAPWREAWDLRLEARAGIIRGVDTPQAASLKPQAVSVRTIDAHVAGAPLRLVVEGFPALGGATAAARLKSARQRHDGLRRALMLEPRGHVDMSGAILTEPDGPGADAGIVFMHVSDYGALCGHGIIAAVTIALERGLITLPPDRRRVVLDTAAGRITARFARDPGGRVVSVAYENPASFVFAAGLTVRAGAREVLADVACCGEFYAIVDAEGAGLPLDAAHAGELRRNGVLIAKAAGATVGVRHPERPELSEFAGTIFTGPGRLGDLCSATVYTDAALDRSPGGTPTGALMAVLDAMGLLTEDHTLTNESLIGTTLRGRIVGRTLAGDLPAIVSEIEGQAFITGEHTFIVDEEDPLGEGYRI